ncbi:MAG: sulfurtransferase [Burkholderiales bacterium]
MPVPFLIEPADLPAALAGKALLLDARPRADFLRGHIPGALPYSTYDVFVPDTTLDGMQAFAASMAMQFGYAGGTLERPVVVYDGDTGMRAAREMWILEYIGHPQARMLHGGYRHWLAGGGIPVTGDDVTTTRPRKLQPKVGSGTFASADELARRADSETLFILDVRDDLEWAGKDDTRCCKLRGHIPKARHIEWTNFLQDGRFKTGEAILELLAQQGIDPNGDLVPYCHRGARSASAYYALRLAGCSGARNFIGSWHEWSAREFPVEV